jgi:flagellar protein FliO/FliZ
VATVKIVSRLSLMASLLFLRCAFAAEVAAPARFADPNVSSTLPSSSATGIGQVTLALLLVLAAVFAVAVLVKRLRAVTGAGANGIELLSQVSLGAKERAVIVRVGNTRLLLGVASGQVSLLHTLPADAPLNEVPAGIEAATRPSFSALLKKSLGR